jgi:predicted dithiol-disulfide oxidoreductase (DUF899 family)
MTSNKQSKSSNEQIANMKKPAVVSAEQWQKAWQEMLVKEKEHTRSRDALAAARRRMPWLAVEKEYVFEGPQGKVSLLDLFEGRRQLVLYRAFNDPNVYGWPDHACVGCSLGSDQVSHLHARDTTLAYASRGSQENIARLKQRMGWEKIPWYTITDDSIKTSASMSGTGTTSSSATRTTGSSARTLSTTVAMKPWAACGTTWTSRHWDGRRIGRTRQRVIRRRHPTSGGAGTTPMATKMPSGIACSITPW